MSVKDKAIECIDTSTLVVEKMLCEIDLAGSLTADKKIEMRDILNGVALSAFEDARQSLNNNESDHYFINPLAVALVTAGAIWGELRGARNVSKMMSDYAKIKLENDPKQAEKKIVKECWEAWQNKPEQYRYKTTFATAMIDKFRPDDPKEESKHLSSVKKITDWCTEWEREKQHPAGKVST